MRSTVRVLVIACLAAAVLVPAATAADRMWVGFQDDPMFRWNPQRMEAMDRARGNDARIVRTVVDWSQVAPDQARERDRSVRPRLQVRRHRRARAERAAARHGGPDHALGHAEVGERRPSRRRSSRRNMSDFQNFARAIASRYSGRFTGYPYVRFFSIWNESNLATFLRPQFDKSGPDRLGAERTPARQGRATPGIKQGNRSALVAIGETSSHGRDHPQERPHGHGRARRRS